VAGFNVTIETLITDLVVRELRTQMPLLKNFAIGVAQGQKSLNDSAQIHFTGVPEDAAEFNATTNNYTTPTGTPDLDAKKVTLDKLLKITKPVTKQQLRNGLSLQNLISSMVKKTVRGAVYNAMSKITLANFGAAMHTGAAATLTMDATSNYAGTAADLGWEVMNMFLATPYYQNLVKDDDYKAIGGDMATELAKTGIVPLTNGWTTFRFPGLPSPVGENLVGFATDGTGLAIGLAENELQLGFEKRVEMYEVVTDEETGFVVSVLLMANDANQAFLTTQVLTGAIVGRTDGLKRIVSA
jgi:hypothetical protein